jgi:hypothetical protein
MWRCILLARKIITNPISVYLERWEYLTPVLLPKGVGSFQWVSCYVSCRLWLNKSAIHHTPRRTLRISQGQNHRLCPLSFFVIRWCILLHTIQGHGIAWAAFSSFHYHPIPRHHSQIVREIQFDQPDHENNLGNSRRPLSLPTHD